MGAGLLKHPINRNTKMTAYILKDNGIVTEHRTNLPETLRRIRQGETRRFALEDLGCLEQSVRVAVGRINRASGWKEFTIEMPSPGYCDITHNTPKEI